MGTELTVTLETGLGSIPADAIAGDERAWIERCQRGDRAAFEPLVQRYMRRAATFALGWAGNHEDALDLSQEAFARAFRSIRRFDPERPFYPWFHRILRNLCINHIGRARHSREMQMEEGMTVCAGDPSPAERAERAELNRQVRAAIERLQPQDREIIILREFQDQSYAEIAEILQIPKGTVMSRLHNARRRLRAEIERSAPDLLHREES
jgi:RNA polymerase sigma-70 factor (ECF subfamily)